MQKDIFSLLERNALERCSRRGYGFWKYERRFNTSPKEYGMFKEGLKNKRE